MTTMTNEAPTRAEGGLTMGSHPAIDRLREIVIPIVDDFACHPRHMPKSDAPVVSR